MTDRKADADAAGAPNEHDAPTREVFEPRAHPDASLGKRQLAMLYERLVQERARVTSGMDQHLNDAISDVEELADELDVARRHTEQAYLMRFADKERKLLIEIDRALEKMRAGEYGVCEGTGEPIELKRLEIRPWTRYSVEYKEQIEKEKRGRG